MIIFRDKDTRQERVDWWEKRNERRKVIVFLLSVRPADDEASSETTGLRSGGGARHQGAQLLPLHGLGETGEQGGAAAIQTKSRKSEPDLTPKKEIQVTLEALRADQRPGG